ncbi:MAG: hypothetical protein OXH84_01675 [Gammaproteobacteria bacterium]|nr:hypothetical protein [Gammaproteobacteria bacterium]
MKKSITFLAMLGLILVLLFALSSCDIQVDSTSAESDMDEEHMEEGDSNVDESEESAEVASGESSEEHSGGESEGAEHAGGESSGDESGEESGTQYAKTDTYDETRNGARLVLNYNSETQTFFGTVENTTDETLTKVRVEVHLSNGTELGPTEPSDLEAGTSQSVFLSAKDEEFDTWGAHPEVGESGGGEHGTEENHD